MTAPRIALISAVQAAVAPAERAFAAAFPQAETRSILDETLLAEALAAGSVTPPLSARMESLIGDAIAQGAAGVLLTCSLYGPVAHAAAARASVPVLASDDAAFADVATGGFGRIALVASLPLALTEVRTRLDAFLSAAEARPTVLDVLAADVTGAAGDEAALADALARALARVGGVDAVLLAQYSLSPAAEALARRIGAPVLAGPARAAVRMREAVIGRLTRQRDAAAAASPARRPKTMPAASPEPPG